MDMRAIMCTSNQNLLNVPWDIDERNVPMGDLVVLLLFMSVQRNNRSILILLEITTPNFQASRNITYINSSTVRVNNLLNRYHLHVAFRHLTVPSLEGVHMTNVFQSKAHTRSKARRSIWQKVYQIVRDDESLPALHHNKGVMDVR